jgi:DNA-directed RNA polymerase subunit RPC12/RpoP
MSESDDGQEQRYGLWIEAEDYERRTPYDDGDVNLDVTEEQADRLIQKFRKCGDAGGAPIQQRGIYLMADTPLTAFPLVLEDGSGDTNLLAESLAENLGGDDLDALIQDLIEASNDRASDGTAIVCEDCGHVRETTEKNPTLVSCQECGSGALRYADRDGDSA